MSKTFFMSFFTPIFFLVYPALKVMLLSHFGHFFQLFWFWFTVFFLSSFEKTCTKIYWTESATAVDKSVYNMFTVSWHQIISRTFNTCVAGLTTESSYFFHIMHIYFLLIFPQYYNIVHIQPPDGIIAYISWNA